MGLIEWFAKGAQYEKPMPYKPLPKKLFTWRDLCEGWEGIFKQQDVTIEMWKLAYKLANETINAQQEVIDGLEKFNEELKRKLNEK